MSSASQNQVAITLPARAENIALVRQAMADYAAHAGVDADVVDDLMLAVSEACANVVVHAYAPADRGLIEVEASTPGDGRVEIRVRDRGRGFRAHVDTRGLGLGLPVIAATTTELDIAPVAGGGTEVAMVFGDAR